MLRWMLLLLWMTRVTLQGGTVISFPAAPTEGLALLIPAVTSLDSSHSTDGSSLSPDASSLPVSVPVMSAGPPDSFPKGPGSPVPPQPELPTLMLLPAPPQQTHIQHLKVHFHPHDSSHTGGNESRYELKGFFGNKYQG